MVETPECHTGLLALDAIIHVLGMTGYLDELATDHRSCYTRARLTAARPGWRALTFRASAWTCTPFVGGLSTALDPRRLAFDGRPRTSPLAHGRFVEDLYSKRRLEQGSSSSQATPFLRREWTKTLMLIFDTREANTHFSEPPYASLAGTKALS